MTDIPAAHFLGRGGDAGEFGAEVALLLDDDDDAVTWGAGGSADGGVGSGAGWDFGGGEVYQSSRRASS